MIDKQFKFSDAARLYAQNKAVVDEMYRLFMSDISRFLDELRDRVAEKITRGSLEEEGKATRAWYIWDEAEHSGDETDVPYVWFRTEDAEIVLSGTLSLFVSADGEWRPHREKLNALLSGLQWGKNARVVPGSGGQTLFTVILNCGNEDPVGQATEPLLAILTALFDAEKQLRPTIGEIGPRKV